MNHKPVLSFDVEDWFQVTNMQAAFDHHKWDDCSNRIDHGLDFILSALAKYNRKATFFILGWIAERYPDVVRRIDSFGHEIATHGYSHRPLTQMSPELFYEDLARSIDILRKLSGRNIEGFRAPSFSVTKETTWAFDIMRRLGIKYDSSIFPVVHPDYGIKDFGRDMRVIDGVIEIPMSTTQLGRWQIPVPGGGYFRLYPYWLSRSLIRKQLQTGQCILYFHPWEFDPWQPRVPLPALKSFRHYVGLDKNRMKFLKLLEEHDFAMLKELVQTTSALRRHVI